MSSKDLKIFSHKMSGQRTVQEKISDIFSVFLAVDTRIREKSIARWKVCLLSLVLRPEINHLKENLNLHRIICLSTGRDEARTFQSSICLQISKRTGLHSPICNYNTASAPKKNIFFVWLQRLEISSNTRG